jgi:uncharacterized protein (TIGR02246 family)
MNRFIAAFLGLVVLHLAGPASAGPLEEVAQLAAARGQAFQDGNADAYSADFADNAVLQSSFSPFRIEGKAAIKAYFVELFLMYPRRHLFSRQPSVRAYNDDLVVQDGYSALNLLNERGEPRNYDIRYSLTWAKTGGRWQIVDQHVSRLPTTP